MRTGRDAGKPVERRIVMSVPKRIWRVVTAFLFCLFLLNSIVFLKTKNVQAEVLISHVKITTDRPLHEHTDIKAFLKSVRLVSPKKSCVKTFKFGLCLNEPDFTPLTSGYAKAGKYIFQIYIELENGYMFVPFDKIKATLNGIPISIVNPMGPGEQPDMTGWWGLTAKPRSIVTFDAAGGKPVPAKQYVFKGAKVKVPKQPAKKGYAFDGWWTDVPKNSTKWNFNQKLYKDLSLIARWKAITTTTTATTTTTTSSHETESTTPLPTEPLTTTTELIEPTTTEALVEITTTSEAIVPDTTFSEPDDTTLPSDDNKGGGDFNLTTFLVTLGTVIFLAALALITYVIVRKKK